MYAFPNAADDKTLVLCNPYNSNDLYAADIASVQGYTTMYSITGTRVTPTFTSFICNATNSPSINQDIVIKGTKLAGVTTLYAMVNENAVYKSSDLGATWVQQGGFFSENAWGQMDVSMDDPTFVCYGGVNAYGSNNSGTNWTAVNDWSAYYGSQASKLHADIMCLQHFRKSDGTEFMIVDCHGGTYVSYNNLATVAAIVKNGVGNPFSKTCLFL